MCVSVCFKSIDFIDFVMVDLATIVLMMTWRWDVDNVALVVVLLVPRDNSCRYILKCFIFSIKVFFFFSFRLVESKECVDM